MGLTPKMNLYTSWKPGHYNQVSCLMIFFCAALHALIKFSVPTACDKFIPVTQKVSFRLKAGHADTDLSDRLIYSLTTMDQELILSERWSKQVFHDISLNLYERKSGLSHHHNWGLRQYLSDKPDNLLHCFICENNIPLYGKTKHKYPQLPSMLFHVWNYVDDTINYLFRVCFWF